MYPNELFVIEMLSLFSYCACCCYHAVSSKAPVGTWYELVLCSPARGGDGCVGPGGSMQPCLRGWEHGGRAGKVAPWRQNEQYWAGATITVCQSNAEVKHISKIKTCPRSLGG